MCIDSANLAVRTDVEGSAVGEPAVLRAVIFEHAVFIGCFLGWIGKQRERGAFLLGEGGIVFQRIRADHEVGHIKGSNLSTALTERLAFGRSATGKRFRKPGKNHRLASELR